MSYCVFGKIQSKHTSINEVFLSSRNWTAAMMRCWSVSGSCRKSSRCWRGSTCLLRLTHGQTLPWSHKVRLQNLIVVQHSGRNLMGPVYQYYFLYPCVQACEAKRPGLKQVQFTGRSKSIDDTSGHLVLGLLHRSNPTTDYSLTTTLFQK